MSTDIHPSELTYIVPGMSCNHCKTAITDEIARVPGVTAVDVDLEGKRVTVRGRLDDASVRDAIAEAGYDAEP
jgi:copper chaperone